MRPHIVRVWQVLLVATGLFMAGTIPSVIGGVLYAAGRVATVPMAVVDSIGPAVPPAPGPALPDYPALPPGAVNLAPSPITATIGRALAAILFGLLTIRVLRRLGRTQAAVTFQRADRSVTVSLAPVLTVLGAVLAAAIGQRADPAIAVGAAIAGAAVLEPMIPWDTVYRWADPATVFPPQA